MFGRGDAFYQQKNKRHVRLEIVDAEPVEGVVFLANGGRLSDLLNDPRSFIPIRRADGETVIIAKQHIVSIVDLAANVQDISTPQDPQHTKQYKNDPYALLQVAPDAPMVEIVAACQRLTKALRNANVACENVDGARLESATHAARKILNAYKLILRERGSISCNGSSASAPRKEVKKEVKKKGDAGQ